MDYCVMGVKKELRGANFLNRKERKGFTQRIQNKKRFPKTILEIFPSV